MMGARGFILGWSLMLSLLLASLVLMGSHGSSLALRSSVNQGEHQRTEALALWVMTEAQARLRTQQAVYWHQSGQSWAHYQRWFGSDCPGGRCRADYDQSEIEVLGGGPHDPAMRYDGPVGPRVLRAPRYVWVLLGQLPDGRLSYHVVVRAWGIDQRRVVTLTAAVLLPTADDRPAEGPKKSAQLGAHALGE